MDANGLRPPQLPLPNRFENRRPSALDVRQNFKASSAQIEHRSLSAATRKVPFVPKDSSTDVEDNGGVETGITESDVGSLEAGPVSSALTVRSTDPARTHVPSGTIKLAISRASESL
jgi:hypothetical protein